MHPDDAADEIFDLITARARQCLPELKGRTRFELAAMLGDLREQIVDVLARTEEEDAA
jgi:hypothetical protein